MSAPRAGTLGFALAGLLLAGAALAAPAAPAARHPAAPRSVLPWIADDYPRALVVARSRKLPIFVENWAPW